MTPQQRKALLWAIALVAVVTHLWHCRWRVVGGKTDSDLFAIRWTRSASDRALRLLHANQAWCEVVERAENQLDLEEGRTQFSLIVPEYAETMALDWFAEAVRSDPVVREEAQKIALQLGGVDYAAGQDRDVMLQRARDVAARKRRLAMVDPAQARDTNKIEFERVVKEPCPSQDFVAGLFVADGVSKDQGWLGGVLVPIGLLGLAWWLRLGWRQRSPTTPPPQ